MTLLNARENISFKNFKSLTKIGFQHFQSWAAREVIKKEVYLLYSGNSYQYFSQFVGPKLFLEFCFRNSNFWSQL